MTLKKTPRSRSVKRTGEMKAQYDFDYRKARPNRFVSDALGNHPAAESLQISIARSIVRQRRAVGLTQVELARLAGIRPETLNRIEKGKHAPSVATVDRIDRALEKARKTSNRD